MENDDNHMKIEGAHNTNGGFLQCV